jgi:hypothetical protein
MTPREWMDSMQTFAGRRLRPPLARALLGLTLRSWEGKNAKPCAVDNRPVRMSEKIVMALLSEVITPNQQAHALEVIERLSQKDSTHEEEKEPVDA